MTTTGSSLLPARLFAEYLQCSTKGQLLWRSPQAESPHFTSFFYSNIKSGSIGRTEHALGRRLIGFDEMGDVDLSPAEQRFLVDCDTAYVDLSRIDLSHRTRTISKS